MQTVDGGGVTGKDVTAASGSIDLTLGSFSAVTIDAVLTALAGGAAPTVAFTAVRLDNSNNPVGTPISFGAAQSAINTGQTLSAGIGSGTAGLNHLFNKLRIAWATTGTPTTATATVSVMGKMSN